MSQRTFTVNEVDALIPALERAFRDIVQLRALLRREEEKLGRAGVVLSRDLAALLEGAGDDRRTPADVRDAKARFRASYEALAEALQGIAALGGEVKDLDAGLVDFPSRREDEDILLCWRLGEKNITHWHPADAGFAARRPVDGLVPREPPRLD